jgi:hypothetical protein
MRTLNKKEFQALADFLIERNGDETDVVVMRHPTKKDCFDLRIIKIKRAIPNVPLIDQDRDVEVFRIQIPETLK